MPSAPAQAASRERMPSVRSGQVTHISQRASTSRRSRGGPRNPARATPKQANSAVHTAPISGAAAICPESTGRKGKTVR